MKRGNTITDLLPVQNAIILVQLVMSYQLNALAAQQIRNEHMMLHIIHVYVSKATTILELPYVKNVAIVV